MDLTLFKTGVPLKNVRMARLILFEEVDDLLPLVSDHEINLQLLADPKILTNLILG